jgi:hypothetical protein
MTRTASAPLAGFDGHDHRYRWSCRAEEARDASPDLKGPPHQSLGLTLVSSQHLLHSVTEQLFGDH